MSASSVEPMRKSTRQRDFDKAEALKARRFKKRVGGDDKWETFIRDNTPEPQR